MSSIEPALSEQPAPVSFVEALAYWLKLGFISFGGPAGQTASICAGGGAPSLSAATELYNGTSWAATASLATARSGSANGIGVNTTAGVQAGGYTGSYTVATEEFTTAAATKTLTSS